MHQADPDAEVVVALTKLVDVAVEVWRLDRWATKTESEASVSTAAARYVVRRLRDFLEDFAIETVDLTGHPYEPGLAVEVLGTERDPTLAPGTSIVNEMVSPICLWQDGVIRHGQVVTRSLEDTQ